MNALRNHHLACGARSEMGRCRADNQDSGYAGPQLALIADGVGSAPAGDLASATIVRALVELLGAPAARMTSQPRTALAAANARLRTLTEGNPGLRGMATTLSGVVMNASQSFIIHIGDSRVYRLRDGCLTQQTEDQTWVQLLIAEGMLQPAAAHRHPMRNMLLHYLSGSASDADAAYIAPIELRTGDRWLLATDGLSDYLPAPALASLVACTADPQELAETLIAECLDASRDNISVVVADVCDGPTGQFGATEPTGRFIGAAETPLDDSAPAG